MRIFKIPRLMKVAGFKKIFKLEKLIKGTALSMFLKLNSGLMKTLGLCVMTVMGLHLASCLFCAIPSLEDNIMESWVYRCNLQDKQPSIIYLNAFYFCFVTLCTVGYGDILAKTDCRLCFMKMKSTLLFVGCLSEWRFTLW